MNRPFAGVALAGIRVRTASPEGYEPDAYAKYKEVLETDPSHPEALAWVEDYLRTKRDYGQLRDVLLASVRLQAS